MQRFGNGLSEGAEDAQADQGVGIPACCVGVLGHLHDHRGNHLPDRANGLEGIGAARLHELTPSVARHDLLDIAAQWSKIHVVFLDETGKVFGRRQADTIPSVLQPSAEGDTGLDVAT